MKAITFQFTHVWAWATWKRSLEHFDLNIGDWPENRETNFFIITAVIEMMQKKENSLDQVFSKKLILGLFWELRYVE